MKNGASRTQKYRQANSQTESARRITNTDCTPPTTCLYNLLHSYVVCRNHCPLTSPCSRTRLPYRLPGMVPTPFTLEHDRFGPIKSSWQTTDLPRPWDF